jgi:hypothetical protein
VEGEASKIIKAGISMMGHPDNQGHPEMIRTWDKQHNGTMFVYDSEIRKEQADRLWEEYRNGK